MSNFLHFWSAFADAQEGFEKALRDEKKLIKEMEQEAELERQQGIGRHFVVVGGYLRQAVDEVFPNASRS